MLNYLHLDERTRRLMLDEVERDVENGTLFVSPRLSNTGQQNYLTLLREAVQDHDDAWLADQLRRHGRLAATEQRRKAKGGYAVAKVPATAAATLAEGEFNRYYIRAVCRRALEDGTPGVVVYAAKKTTHPRPEALRLLDETVNAQELLDDLRAHPGADTKYRVPPGPNSGLSVRLPTGARNAGPKTGSVSKKPPRRGLKDRVRS